MNAGDLNKRIELLVMGTGKDPDGYPIEEEVSYRKLWSKVSPVSAKEYSQAKADQTENITKFVVRYNKSLNITDDMTILYRDKKFSIESVINDEEKNITLTIIGRSIV